MNSNEPNVVPLSKSISPDIEVTSPNESVPPLPVLSNTTKSPSSYPVPRLDGSTKTFSTFASSILPTSVFAACPIPSSDCGKLTVTFSDIEYNAPFEFSSDFIEPPITASDCGVLTVSLTMIGVLPWTSFIELSDCVPSSSKIRLLISGFTLSVASSNWNASVSSDSDEKKPVPVPDSSLI